MCSVSLYVVLIKILVVWGLAGAVFVFVFLLWANKNGDEGLFLYEAAAFQANSVVLRQVTCVYYVCKYSNNVSAIEN